MSATYSSNICLDPVIRYKGKRLLPSNSAINELLHHGTDLDDCKDILENGYSPRKRAKGTEEKWLDVGKKTYNVVVVDTYTDLYKEDVWLITHFGKFTKK